MRNKIGFSCLLILVLLGSRSAIAAEVPLPTQINIVLPSANLPKEIGAFSGRWEGTWEGTLQAVLIVEEIGPEKAKVIYAWADAPAWNVKPGYKRYAAEVIAGGKTTLEFTADNKVKYVVELGDEADTIRMVALRGPAAQFNPQKRLLQPERKHSREVIMKKVK